MGRFNLTFTILTKRKPLKGAVGVLQAFITAVKEQLLQLQDELNTCYESRFITTATGESLDRWGLTLGVGRNDGESDSAYRERLLTAFRADLRAGCQDIIAKCVYDIIGVNPTFDEHHMNNHYNDYIWYKDITYKGNRNMVWRCSMLDLWTTSLIVPAGVTDEQILQMAAAIFDKKLVQQRFYIVDPDRTLRKEVYS